MRWFRKKRPDRDALLGEIKKNLLVLEKRAKLANVLTGGDRELSDTLLITAAEPVVEQKAKVEKSGIESDLDRWGPDELGVESLFLPFGVRRGWGDDSEIDVWTPELKAQSLAIANRQRARVQREQVK